MPQSVLSFRRVVEGLHPAPSVDELRELCAHRSKAELASVDGDAVTIEVTPDRLDLLSEGGLRQHLEGLLGRRLGLPALPRADDAAALRIEVDRNVAPLRPAIAAVAVQPPPGGLLDAGLLVEVIRFQELLHATIGLDRRSASLGVYPLERLRPPFVYRRRPLAGLSFVPLDATEPVAAGRFFEEHPYAVRYGGLGRVGDECLVLEDSVGTVLSLPPILNSRTGGEARVGDHALLLESTGQRAARVEDALGLFELPFVAHGWSVRPVSIGFPDRAETGARYVRPSAMRLARSTLAEVSGLSLSDEEGTSALHGARLGAERSAEGWSVEVPPWRPDLLGEVDLVEEVLLARGLQVADRRLSPSATRGRRLADRAVRREVAARLLGLGFVPLYTPVLTSEQAVARLGRPALELSNPVSVELSRLRSTLGLSLFESLRRNVRYGYPQRLSEVGPVVVADGQAETGATTRQHAGFVLAEDRAGFAEGAALVDYLLRRWQLAGVREPAEIPGMIAGRAARVRLAGETVAEVGELHPALLEQLGVPVTAVWGEVDLTALLPLLGR